MSGKIDGQAGVDAFVRGVSRLAWLAYHENSGDRSLVNQVAADYANICLRDIVRPVRFLRQMAGAPPVQLGTEGFRADLIDDYNPARHYTALLFIGFFAPTVVAMVVLFAWEIAGFVRYGGHWSRPDIRSGLVGIRHGRLVRKYGGVVLPSLIAAQVAESCDDWESSPVSSGSEEETELAA